MAGICIVAHRVHEAGRQPAEPSVSQASVGFLLQRFVPINVFLHHQLPHDRVKQQVGNVIFVNGRPMRNSIDR